MKNIDGIKPYCFKPGQNGNSTGLNKGSQSLVPLLRKLLRKKVTIHDDEVIDVKTGEPLKRKVTAAEAIVLTLVKKAIEGDMKAINIIIERTDGKVLESFTGIIDQNVNQNIPLTFIQAYEMKYGKKQNSGYKTDNSSD
ncbi:MAG: DUF5681 domain-containing protein [Candidatus Neomarinimicrobiota bacterium]